MSKATEILNMLEQKWDLHIKRAGKWDKANKKPMSKKELEDMMKEFEKSGVEVDDMKSTIL